MTIGNATVIAADPPDLVAAEPPCEETHVEGRREVEAERRHDPVGEVGRPETDPADQNRVHEHRHRDLQNGENAALSLERAFCRLEGGERAVRDDDRSDPMIVAAQKRVPTGTDVHPATCPRNGVNAARESNMATAAISTITAAVATCTALTSRDHTHLNFVAISLMELLVLEDEQSEIDARLEVRLKPVDRS